MLRRLSEAVHASTAAQRMSSLRGGASELSLGGSSGAGRSSSADLSYGRMSTGEKALYSIKRKFSQSNLMGHLRKNSSEFIIGKIGGNNGKELTKKQQDAAIEAELRSFVREDAGVAKQARQASMDKNAFANYQEAQQQLQRKAGSSS